jgi:hypothetical protein
VAEVLGSVEPLAAKKLIKVVTDVARGSGSWSVGRPVNAIVATNMCL